MYHLGPKVFIPLYDRPLDKSRHSLDFVAVTAGNQLLKLYNNNNKIIAI